MFHNLFKGHVPAVPESLNGIVSERCLPFGFNVISLEVLLRAKRRLVKQTKKRFELFTVNELKRFLRDLGQPLSGTKA